MSALFLVVPLALIVSAGAVVAFIWSVRRGQLDDLQTPALRMLADDEETRPARYRPEGQGVDVDGSRDSRRQDATGS
jgi:cbb3-type cytochrome oxidase maturation protein